MANFVFHPVRADVDRRIRFHFAYQPKAVAKVSPDSRVRLTWALRNDWGSALVIAHSGVDEHVVVADAQEATVSRHRIATALRIGVRRARPMFVRAHCIAVEFREPFLCREAKQRTDEAASNFYAADLMPIIAMSRAFPVTRVFFRPLPACGRVSYQRPFLRSSSRLH